MKQESKLKAYISAPLPFQGQKRRFLKSFREIIKDSNKNTTFVDLFGGSGLLSHTAKRLHPGSRVVYNDYDNYQLRLVNIQETNALLADVRLILKDYPPDKKIAPELKEIIIKRLEAELKTRNYVDWLTLSSSLLFSMKYVQNFNDFKSQSLYNVVRHSNYTAENYLNGIEVVRMDYEALFDQFKKTPNVVFFVDPPYLSTDVSSYQKDKFWELKDYLDVLNVLKGTSYVFFTSNKSSIIELCEWMGSYSNVPNIFQDATRYEINGPTSKGSMYTDIMLCKFRS